MKQVLLYFLLGIFSFSMWGAVTAVFAHHDNEAIQLLIIAIPTALVMSLLFGCRGK